MGYEQPDHEHTKILNCFVKDKHPVRYSGDNEHAVTNFGYEKSGKNIYKL